MFYRKDLSQKLIDFPEVHVLYVGSWNKGFPPTASLVCFSINNCQIIMASHHFNPDYRAVKKANLYQQLSVCGACNLLTITHGDDDDTPHNNMPRFEAAADEMHQYFNQPGNQGKTVLVNCNNGRSRTGTVVAFYLMKHNHYTAEQAITIVTAVLRFRGIVNNSINIQTRNLHGNYADWLKRWEKSKLEGEQNVDNEQPDRLFKRRRIRRIDADDEYQSLEI